MKTKATYWDTNIPPKEDDFALAPIIGKKGTKLMVWRICVDCNIGEWITAFYGGRPRSIRCIACSNRQKSLRQRARTPKPKGTLDNPVIGDIRYNDEINKNGKSGRWIYIECPDCQKRRWIDLYGYKSSLSKGKNGICVDCERHSDSRRLRHRGANCPTWKGGIQYKEGYRLIYVTKDSPFAPMISTRMYHGAGYVLEHRLVMAKSLGRCLHKWEIIHHKNHIRDDNRLENLELMVHGNHHVYTILENRINILEDKLDRQSQTISLLLWHIKMLNHVSVKRDGSNL